MRTIGAGHDRSTTRCRVDRVDWALPQVRHSSRDSSSSGSSADEAAAFPRTAAPAEFAAGSRSSGAAGLPAGGRHQTARPVATHGGVGRPS